ncbi:S-adenosyl-L-methionine-dependent methyltransferase [Triangularia verruculosa]|uniref:Protein-lysine N-methyltransferase EFM4 n=1 Tax=Triangularia verruculosa TaxID=2587418 RepID=A0AAN7AX07_9PEZI|nr:S-adenosyl-L-methionine-dependent methyltransferase [Triangularia verruculosa]
MAESKPTPLEPSKLGTKAYWDALYTTELTTHTADPSLEGTVWFDDSDAEAKILSYLSPQDGSHPNHPHPHSLSPATASVLDLGCGNGSLLFSLRDDGWSGHLLGVDYSPHSIALARQVALSRESESLKTVEFKVWDVLNGDIPSISPPEAAQGWDLVLDKGTFDAVSLSDEKDSQGRRINEGYGERVLQLLRTGGVFFVTSCNWTEAELREWFETSTAPNDQNTKLRMVGRIDYPSFSFGGVKGQTISTLCFEKVVVDA